MKRFVLPLLFLITYQFVSAQTADFKGQKLSFKTEDNVLVTADLYELEDKEAPLILLFHQAGFSRGEYREIAPLLNKEGFRCLAIDQRSGKAVNGVPNETNKEAIKQGKPTQYPDAIPDLEAALQYAKKELSASKIIIWGSSYSSSLVFYLASQHPKDIAAVVSCSPGEYFTVEGKSVADFAKKVTCPVFITSAKNEQRQWQAIYDAIPSTEKTFFLPEQNGFHGSKALWESKEGHEAYRASIFKFLAPLK